MTNHKKRGALSTEEELYIIDNKDKKSIEDIANYLNRSVDPINKFLKEKAVDYFKTEQHDKNAYLLKQKLHDKAWWPEVKKHFSNNPEEGELQFFEKMWVELMKQFREDVLATEEVEIKEWINLEILKNRLLNEHEVARQEIKQLRKLIDKELEKNIPDRDTNQLDIWKVEINMLHASCASFNKDHMAILGQIKDIRKDFKMARSDRIKKIEDGKVSWSALIRMLDETSEREKQGLEAEILARAAEKAKKNLMKTHTYLDDRCDSPLLSAETIINNQKESENEKHSKIE